MARSTVFIGSVEGGQEACLGVPRHLPCWLPLRTTPTPGFPGATPPARGAGLGGCALPRSLPAALSEGSVSAALQRVRGAGWGVVLIPCRVGWASGPPGAQYRHLFSCAFKERLLPPSSPRP